jgi:DNA polymerase III subunit delta'
MIYPWQQKAWQHLLSMKNNSRLPHALLFTGVAGIGKTQFTQSVIHALLCQQFQNDHYCGECHACRLIIGQAHPNVLWIVPEKAGHAIKIDQIRAANEFIQQSAFSGEHKIAVIHPADSMNINAANALLKTLEEPSPASLLILVSDQPQRLPATILSRCQRVTFHLPAKAEALSWLCSQLTIDEAQADLLLNLSHGAPLKALQLAKDDVLTQRQTLFAALQQLSEKKATPLALASDLQALDTLYLTDVCLSLANDLLRLQMQIKELNNADYENVLMPLSQKIKPDHLHIWLSLLLNLRKKIAGGLNLNKQLLIEMLLIRWMEYST